MPEPTSVFADGNVKIAWVPTIANPAAPTATELNAGFDLSCYLTADGYTPGGDTATVTDDRLCSRQTFSKPGRRSETLTIGYVYQGQEDAAADNEAFDTLKNLTTGYFVERWGADYEPDFATGDIVNVKPAQLDEQMEAPPEANSVLRINQNVFITGEVQRGVAVVAGA